LPQRILRQIRIETHQSQRRETDQSGDWNKARCKRVVVAVGNCTRDVCSCTSLSVFVYRVRALSAAVTIYISQSPWRALLVLLGDMDLGLVMYCKW